jgi:hypothetical protein
MRSAPTRPVCWRLHPADAERSAAEHEHCETRRCHNPVAVVTWRYYRSAEVGRELVAEHIVCEQHGQEFAGRHHIGIEPAPAEPSRRGRAFQAPGGEQ